MEKIGNVILDDTHYPGEDLYSDGVVEDHILELVQTYPESEYPQVIAREKDWAVMYHLAHGRENILSWYPFEPGAKVLEVGAGCGAVTGALAALAGSVTCIDLSKKRSMINATRHKDSDNIQICLGNFQDVEQGLACDFDYATLIGVFEYGRGYIGGDTPYHGFLSTVMEHLRPGGKLLMAIENKFGLKYWAGCREDHVGTYFEGLEGYPKTGGVRTFTRPELIQIIEACGYTDYQFYYPYPDYKFPLTIYSDQHLPKVGELKHNLCNFDRDRLLLMEEEKVYDQIIKDGLFSLYSNSFFVEITKPGAEKKQQAEQVFYTKYSSGRVPEFSIQTRIAQNIAGKPILYKQSEFLAGQKHIHHMAEAGKRLQELWQDEALLKVNHNTLHRDRIEFEYLEGITLEEQLDLMLEQGRYQEAVESICNALRRIKDSAPTEIFEMTPEFQQVFGQSEILSGEPAVSVADVDLIFSNLLCTEDGEWHVLDYEWTFFFPVPIRFILYRALHYYLQLSPGRRKLEDYCDFYREFGITSECQSIFSKMEQQFQNYISGESISLAGLYPVMGKRALPLEDLLEGTDRRRVQIYLDYGEGFSEQNSYFIETYYKEKLQYRVTVPELAAGIWIDPALSACILSELELSWTESGLPVQYRTTGFSLEENCFLFDNSDPKIIIEEIPQGRGEIQVSYQISILEQETAKLLMGKLNPPERRKKKSWGLIKG